MGLGGNYKEGRQDKERLTSVTEPRDGRDDSGVTGPPAPRPADQVPLARRVIPRWVVEPSPSDSGVPSLSAPSPEDWPRGNFKRAPGVWFPCREQPQMRCFTKGLIQEALTALDMKLGKSNHIRQMAKAGSTNPSGGRVRMVTCGGTVAVTIFNSRSHTAAIDYFLDPKMPAIEAVKDEVDRAIRTVAQENNYQAGWASDDKIMRYLKPDAKEALGRLSVAQDAKVYSGKYLMVYALDWEIMTACKIKKIGDKYRQVDVNDATEALRRIHQGKPARFEMVRHSLTVTFRSYLRGDPFDEAMDKVNTLYKLKYGTDGLVSQRRDFATNPDASVNGGRMRVNGKSIQVDDNKPFVLNADDLALCERATTIVHKHLPPAGRKQSRRL